MNDQKKDTNKKSVTNKDKKDTKTSSSYEERFPVNPTSVSVNPNPIIEEIPATIATLTLTEVRLLRDIKIELTNVKKGRLLNIIDLGEWLRAHNYDKDFITAAKKL